MAKDGGSIWIGADGRSLDDVWRVYEANPDGIFLATMAIVAANPAYAPLVGWPLGARSSQRASTARSAPARSTATGTATRRACASRAAAMPSAASAFGGWHDLSARLSAPARAAPPGRLWLRRPTAPRARSTRCRCWSIARGRSSARSTSPPSSDSVEEQRELARSSDARYRMLFDNSPVPMWVYDRETHRFLAVNRAVVEHLRLFRGRAARHDDRADPLRRGSAQARRRRPSATRTRASPTTSAAGAIARRTAAPSGSSCSCSTPRLPGAAPI